MDKKEKFIEFIQIVLDDVIDTDSYSNYEYLSDALEFWEAFKSNKTIGGITENGTKILQYMQDNIETHSNLFSAKDIGEGLSMSSRSVSGAMRKLITDGYVIKNGNNPVIYSLSNVSEEYQYQFDN